MKTPLFKDRPELLTHGLSLLVSLLIHTAALYFLVTHFVSVRIIEFKNPVTPVIIVPPPPLQLPETARNPANLPEVIEGFPDFLPSRTLPPRTGLPPLASSFEEPIAPSRVEIYEPKFTTGFRLDQTPPEKSGTTSGDRLRLPIRERMKGSVDDLTRPTTPPKDVDWRKYLSVGAGGSRGYLSGPSSRRSRVRSSLRSGSSVSADIKKYNLSPWASKVVTLIQKNWDIPPTRPANPDSAVEIVVVLQKSGQVSGLEVVVSSDDQSFNQAARFAVELSSPFPPLPEDFPAASLEISFVFTVQ